MLIENQKHIDLLKNFILIFQVFMANKDRSLIFATTLFVILCLYSYYYKKYELPLLPEPTDDVEWHVRGIIYPLSFIFNFALALGFYLISKFVYFIKRRLKRHF